MGDSSESVIFGEKDLKRDVGIQASVPDVKRKHDDADDSDDEDIEEEEADAQKGSIMKKSKKIKEVKMILLMPKRCQSVICGRS